MSLLPAIALLIAAAGNGQPAKAEEPRPAPDAAAARIRLKTFHSDLPALVAEPLHRQRHPVPAPPAAGVLRIPHLPVISEPRAPFDQTSHAPQPAVIRPWVKSGPIPVPRPLCSKPAPHVDFVVDCPAPSPPSTACASHPHRHSSSPVLKAQTIHLKHVSVARALQRLAAELHAHKIQTAGRGPLGKVRLIVVPEPAGNSLLLVASPQQLQDVHRILAEIDKRPPMYQFEIKVTELRADGTSRVIAEPNIITLRDRPARMLTSIGPRTVLQVEMQIGKPAPKPARPGVAVIRSAPAPFVPPMHCPIPTVTRTLHQSAPAARDLHHRHEIILRTSAVRTNEIEAAPAPSHGPEENFSESSEPTRLDVRAYAVPKLLGKDATAKEAEAFAALIRMAAPRESWSQAGGPGTIGVYAKKQCVVVRQTPASHEQIAKLLEQLRAICKGR